MWGSWNFGAVVVALWMVTFGVPICGVPVCGVPVAHAQSEAPQEAIELYRAGRAHYDAGRYRDAIIDLKAALALDPESPNLLYNVARVSELLGNLDEAIAYYTRYIGMLSDSENDERERISATIRRLEGARTELSAHANEQPETLREVIYREPPPPGTADTLFWVVGGSGVALLGGSIVTGILALAREDSARTFVLGEDGNATDRRTIITQANTFALASDLMLIGGVSAIGVATLLYFLRQPEAPTERRIQVGMASDGRDGLLTLRGAF